MLGRLRIGACEVQFLVGIFILPFGRRFGGVAAAGWCILSICSIISSMDWSGAGAKREEASAAVGTEAEA